MKLTRKKVQDKRFNPFIRLRDSRKWDGQYFECISCHLTKHKSHLQAGHYYHYSVSGALTFDEVNVNGQCGSCNLNMGADPSIVEGYKKGLIKKYGPGVMNYLDSKKKNKVFFHQVGLHALDSLYESLIKQIKNGVYTQKLPYFK